MFEERIYPVDRPLMLNVIWDMAEGWYKETDENGDINRRHKE